MHTGIPAACPKARRHPIKSCAHNRLIVCFCQKSHQHNNNLVVQKGSIKFGPGIFIPVQYAIVLQYYYDIMIKLPELQGRILDDDYHYGSYLASSIIILCLLCNINTRRVFWSSQAEISRISSFLFLHAWHAFCLLPFASFVVWLLLAAKKFSI